MAKRKNSNKGWILGTVLGAVVGAAYALWKTPMSGQELRGKLSPGPISSSSDTNTSASGGFTDKIMSTVERTLAPIVGVELGKTANGKPAGSHEVTEPIAVNTVSDDTSFSTSLRSRRFEWGSPTPEANDDVQTPSAPETAAVEPNLPEAAPETESTHATGSAHDTQSADAAPSTEPTREAPTDWGEDTIRSKRFAWGEAAPEAMTVTPSAEVAPVDPVTVDTSANAPQATRFSDHNAGIATDTGDGVVDPYQSAAAAASTGKLHPFPKLGGLEDNN